MQKAALSRNESGEIGLARHVGGNGFLALAIGRAKRGSSSPTVTWPKRGGELTEKEEKSNLLHSDKPSAHEGTRGIKSMGQADKAQRRRALPKIRGKRATAFYKGPRILKGKDRKKGRGISAVRYRTEKKTCFQAGK